MSKTNIDDILGTTTQDTSEPDENVKEDIVEPEETIEQQDGEEESVTEDKEKYVETTDAAETVSEELQENSSITEETKEESNEETEETIEDKKDVAEVEESTDDVEESVDIEEGPDEKDVISAEEVSTISYRLIRPVTTFRGPSKNLAQKPFGGTITITGNAVNGFVPVQFVRSGLGLCNCYMLAEEVDRCRFLK